MIRLTGRLIAKTAEDSAIIRRYLPEHQRLSRAEDGCLLFEVVESDDPLIWQVEELYTDQRSFDGHQTRTRNSEWWEKTAAISREYSIHEESDIPVTPAL
ncbi:putative quinol monooxygenase [Tatumella terrea]|uniref:Quinol monooxygenase n=1 Tax=Tatumella terrea TaxID=419007 RepID=A0ABW1W156_9GAMM|nr:antibiotic biosynthesis monooxygenase [Tatumella sp. JGM118]MBS0909956.1 antibiotic biosynthesis monooxygenase [Tatumella sp. JGM118]